ncbi:hypothetical protein CANCADRAFT_21242 [Tortispora caseinolytica NRRL Y-17796]|uniref:RNA helicase n=1 Tax=Tortispora caseinolytica NRRL Y-17796 TaxID=767744 RepID=A0A1E4TKL3_9ASCO|nr:hypothetical protein CANCADRAFT_21242 [Tortispora caseinolytica NRRL Y-17796]
MDSLENAAPHVHAATEVYDSDSETDMNGYADNSADTDPAAMLQAARARTKKEVAAIDHTKVQYHPFRKAFYTEPQELAVLTSDELSELRLLKGDIKVRGKSCPAPVSRWTQLGLPTQIMSVIESLNYDIPTPIQSQALPVLMSGRDLVAIAQTGSGKTMSFLLPLFRHVIDQPPLQNGSGFVALVLTPTRELAIQIHRECKPFLKALSLKSICAYGGYPLKDQIAEFKRGAEIVVSTPGRLIDILTANQGKVTSLHRVTYVVLDEADRMFDMGFEPQVTKIVQNIRPDKQFALFSATFPRHLEVLARKVLHKPIEIIVGARSVVAENVTQIVELQSEETKFHRLLDLLGRFTLNDSSARILIFVEKQESADTLLKMLFKKGYRCGSIHGGKEQFDRDSMFADFKSGVINVLIATSVAARGLDVKELKLVINYDCPSHMEDYVHRVGRTGRAGASGTAYTFVTPDQGRKALGVIKALEASGQTVPEDIQKLADDYIKQAEDKGQKLPSGFGGSGLDKLDQLRNLSQHRERIAYGEDEQNNQKEELDENGDLVVPPHSETHIAPSVLKASSAVSKSNNNTSGSTPSSTATKTTANDNDGAKYHATFTINDFPAKARWAATNRTNVVRLIDNLNISVTNKGTYYPEGKTPGPNDDPKLYLLIEGDTKESVEIAIKELQRLVSEAMSDIITNDAKPSGRYSVV